MDIATLIDERAHLSLTDIAKEMAAVAPGLGTTGVRESPRRLHNERWRWQVFPATLTRNNGHIRRILIVALTALMLFATLAIAPGAQADEPVNTTPDGYRGSGNNQVSKWCAAFDGGYKDESPATPFSVPSPGVDNPAPSGSEWTMLVIKTSNASALPEGQEENAYWEPPHIVVGALYAHPSVHANSHVILCWDESDEPTTGTIVVEKVTVDAPDGDMTEFPFSQNVDATGDFALKDGETKKWEGLTDGATFKVKEGTLGTGWELTDISCDNELSSGDVGTGEADFEVVGGETVTCTFTNTYTPPDEPEYKITFVKRVCEDYEDIRANYANAGILAENAGTLGSPISTELVNPANEGEVCTPKSGWNFWMGSGYDSGGTPDDLSYATGLHGTYATLGSTPLLDAYGQQVGDETLAGAVTVTLTAEQAASRLWISEALTADKEIPGGYGFGAIRCDVDNLHGDNAEFVEFDTATPIGLDVASEIARPVTHKFCYAYNVAPEPPPERASLTIVKKTIGGNGTFKFESDKTDLGDFSIKTTGGSGSEVFSPIAIGKHVVSEKLGALGANWSFVDVKCDADEQSLDQTTATATVHLAPGDHVTCTFTNERTPPPPVDPDNPAIDIEKATNGNDADTWDEAKIIPKGDLVTWTYVVKNTGDVALTNVNVTDDKLGNITCPKDTLAVGESMTCTVTGTAGGVDYANVGAVSGFYRGVTVTDSDPSHYKVDTEVKGTAQLGDTVWVDANNNGVQDNGEDGYNGAKVILTDADGNVIGTLTTATGAWVGFYKFVGLDAGTYTATLDLTTIEDYGVTTANAFTVTLAEGDDYLDADFGLYKAEEAPEEELPKTGTDSEGLALLALGLLMVGGLAVLSTRRRRSEEN